MTSVAQVVFDRAPGLSGLIMREGARGCDLYRSPDDVVHVDAPAVDVVDTNGAGDVHVGAFVAALARGEDPALAVRSANEAAAFSVTQRGPATAPSR